MTVGGMGFIPERLLMMMMMTQETAVRCVCVCVCACVRACVCGGGGEGGEGRDISAERSKFDKPVHRYNHPMLPDTDSSHSPLPQAPHTLS